MESTLPQINIMRVVAAAVPPEVTEDVLCWRIDVKLRTVTFP